MQNHRFQDSDLPHKIPKLHATGPNSLGSLVIKQSGCLKSGDINETGEDDKGIHEPDSRMFCADPEFNALISLMSSRLPTSQANFEFEITHRDGIHLESETNFSAAETIMSQPIRSSSGGIFSMAPPKRFYRTFWRSIAGKAMVRERSLARADAAEPSHPLNSHLKSMKEK